LLMFCCATRYLINLNRNLKNLQYINAPLLGTSVNKAGEGLEGVY
jgi:hypothetical protein